MDQRITVSSNDVIGAARTGGLVLGGYVAFSVAVATLLLLLQDSSGSPLNWLRGGVVLAALGLHSRVFLQVDNAGGGDNSFSFNQDLTVTYGIVPLLFLGVVVLLAYRLAGRAERAAPSQHSRQAAVLAVVAAAIATLGLVVLVRVTRFDNGLGLGDSSDAAGTAGAQIMPLLLWGLPILAIACAAGRLADYRRAQGQRPLRQELAARSFGLSPWVATSALHAVLTGALLTVAGLVYGLLTSDHEVQEGTGDFTGSDVAGVLLGLLLLPNLALAATGFFMGFSASSGGLAAAFNGGSAYGLLHGDLPAKAYLWCLAPLVVALLIGVRRVLHTSEQARLTDGWWQAGVGSVLLWVPLSLLLRVGFSGGGLFGGDTGIGFTAGSLLLVAFGWGVLVLLLGRLAARPLVEAVPQVATRLGGERIHPSWRILLGLPVPTEEVIDETPTEPALPRMGTDVLGAPPKNPVSRRTIALIATVAGVLVIGGISYAVLDRKVYGPTAAVDGYLSALADGKVSEAVSQLDQSTLEDRTLLTAEALPPGKRITDAKVTQVRRNGRTARVTVTYQLGGRRQSDVLTVRQKGSRGVLFHDWQIVDGLGTLRVEAIGRATSLLVNGIEVSPTDGRAELPVLPGIYEATLPAGSLFDAQSAPARVTINGQQSLEIQLDLSAAAIDRAKAATLAYLNACLAKASTLDTSCGFRAYVYADRYEGVHWTLVGEPDFEVNYDESSQGVRVSSNGTLEARVTGTAIQNDFFGDAPTRTSIDEIATDFLSGSVDLGAATPTFRPGY